MEDLKEGLHTYYIHCGNDSNPMRIEFATSIPIYATVSLSENPPLKEGKYTIDLITSKTPLETPTLEYSFDDVVYKPISLKKGTGQNWQGNLIIPATTGNAVFSFRFSAKDLSGYQGTEIKGENLFVVDTIQPPTVGIINAVGYDGQIKLDWFYDEKVKEFNLYRSENPGIDYTDFYKTSSKNSYIDYNVEKGKTYYYRVAGVDEAGNIGDLSKEVYATALLNNYTSASGLNPSLVGKVDNAIAETNSVINNINDIKSSLNLKENKEKTLFADLQLDQSLSSAVSELNSLKRDLEGYKLQDLSEGELDSKLASATLRLNILKKQVPEDITIMNEDETERALNEDNIQRGFLEYFSGTTDAKSYDREITQTLKEIELNNIKISSSFYIIEIMYMDGTKKRITLIEDEISSSTNNPDNLSFIEIIPKEIAEQSSELKIMNLGYTVIKDDPIIEFNSNTKKIIYYLNREVDLSTLQSIVVMPIKLPGPEENQSKITGNFIANVTSKGSWEIIILVVFALGLGIYFLRMKNESSAKPALIILENIKKSKELLKAGKTEEANKVYDKVKEEYKLLSDKEKRIIMEGMKELEGGTGK